MTYPFALAAGKTDREGQETDLSGLAKGAAFEEKMCERPSRQSHQSGPDFPDHPLEMGWWDLVFNGKARIR
jgi:hypothetical protein